MSEDDPLEDPLDGGDREDHDRPGGGAEGDAPKRPDDEPLSGLTDRVRERRDERAEGSGEEPFEEIEVGDLDAEAVWESLGESERVERDLNVGAGASAERVERSDPASRREDYLVPKRDYCQKCRFFSAPPETVCTHEGTEIVEMPDSEHFRVRGCPMVDDDGVGPHL